MITKCKKCGKISQITGKLIICDECKKEQRRIGNRAVLYLLRQWEYLHPEKLRIAQLRNIKKYFKTPKGKIASNRHSTKRRRNLGFNPLNEPFTGSVAHHIDLECVVYIPEFIHTSISHNIWTGKGMTEINNKVFEWLTERLI